MPHRACMPFAAIADLWANMYCRMHCRNFQPCLRTRACPARTATLFAPLLRLASGRTASVQSWVQPACVPTGRGELVDAGAGCDRACHFYCAGLTAIPEDDYFCPICTAAEAEVAENGQTGYDLLHQSPSAVLPCQGTALLISA